ncbi:TetR/AcrR family transcriptional regulator [Chitinophaga pendula]|uniref:TetR/AcrR family transcriptional regulator n=1 Tax=Chitinophaga TaxID=79328 RepID=UPI000BB03E56|nr:MULTISPECIES: TetR/AcrR family transcriptional regulator [Chitinophaga]ASZ12255.1 hypothetical protein CK934_15440 [Chitinophaga sp. MD30]UCJ10160.1 TetR/AcrR family transcriptional regulator [Chitinophaga pendula]
MNKKEAILKSVLKLVNRGGFYHLNMKNIAQEADVAAGTIYVHFKGKEELINALYQMVVSDFNAHVLKGYNPERAFRENFFEMMNNAVGFYLDDPDGFSFIEQYTYSPLIFKETQQENFIILEPIYQMVRDAIRLKEVKDLPEALLVAMVYGPLEMMMKFHLARKTDLTKHTNRQQLVNTCWENIALNPAAPPPTPAGKKIRRKSAVKTND